MNTLMCLQVLQVRKSIFTVGTFQHVSCMEPLVFFKALIFGEFLFTEGTCKFISMRFLVSLQVKRKSETLVTFRAFKRPLACMACLVYLQFSRGTIRFVAVGTGKRLISCMLPFVIPQGTRVRKLLITPGAGKGLLSCMYPLVYF